MSSLLENAGNLLNRGVAAAGRGTKSISLKNQINDLVKRREKLTAELGADLYTVTRFDPNFRAPRESIYGGIESMDAQIEALQIELANIEQEAQTANAAQPVQAPAAFCPSCGNALQPSDAFCRNCGTAAQAKGDAAPVAPVAYPDTTGFVAASDVPFVSSSDTAGAAVPASAEEAPFVSAGSADVEVAAVVEVESVEAVVIEDNTSEE